MEKDLEYDLFFDTYELLPNARIVKEYTEQGLDLTDHPEIYEYNPHDDTDFKVISNTHKTTPNNLWTFCIEDGERSVYSISNGYHYVNRFHYFISLKAGTEHETYSEIEELEDDTGSN